MTTKQIETADCRAPRERLAASLDAIFQPKIERKHNLDSVEPKLFGIRAESYTAGSHEFYLAYAINRVAAWVIGTRNMLKALLLALTAPIARLKQAELTGDYTTRLALMEEMKTLPFGAVWDHYCQWMGVPVGGAWLAEVQGYEKAVLSKRA